MAELSPRDAKSRVVRFNDEVFNGRNYDLLDELMTDDIVVHETSLPDEIKGREAFKAYLQLFHESFSDLKATIEDQIVEGDKVVTRYTYNGTHDGEFMGMPATNRTAKISGIVINRMEGDKVAETWASADFLGLMQQLELIPSQE
ncbi:ester cyclase [Haladaptatus sp. DJG-WS-42]|uniref:ester cyclase n=1 Tax=Haladaptatus sp. DJG-WS-42 TaxID=3120516 RepID=UPI0030D3D4AC